MRLNRVRLMHKNKMHLNAQTLRREIGGTKNDNLKNRNILIFDTGGGKNPTIAQRAWTVFETTSHQQEIRGYQDTSGGKICPIVNAVTKAFIPGRDLPVIFIVHYAALIDDPDEYESLIVPFDMMRHGVKCDLTPQKLGGGGGMIVEDEFIPMLFDDEKLFIRITKPDEIDLEELEFFELNSPAPPDIWEPIINHRAHKKTLPGNLPLSEWKKRLAMLPDDIIKKTIENTTQFYMNVECENRQNPRHHYKSRFPALRLKRQNEMVASDTFFPSIQTNRGHTCSQFFAGTKSDRWEVFPLKSECNNGTALQDYSRRIGVPPSIKTDCAQSELGTIWTDHCRRYCIDQQTTEPHSPWQNPGEPRIGNLNNMVSLVMKAFNVPLGEHDWAQKWCCDCHNAAASKRVDWHAPLTISEGHTNDISKF